MVYLNGIASYLPNEPVSNDLMETVLGKIEGIPSRARSTVLRNNGIASRYYAIDPRTRKATHSNAELTAAAVLRLLDQSRTPLSDIDLLCCGTSSNDLLFPSHAAMVQGELGGETNCEIVSTGGVCGSSIAAMKYAWLSLTCGDKKRAVVTGSEVASKFLRAERFGQESSDAERRLNARPLVAFEHDFLRWMLSDGAAALLLADQPSADNVALRIDWIDSVSFANELDVCMYAGGTRAEDRSTTSWLDHPVDACQKGRIFNIYQDVRYLEKNICSSLVTKALPGIIEKRKLKSDAINWFVPHYSSNYFKNRLAQAIAAVGLAIPDERWFTTLTTRGNIGSASFFVYLDDLIHSGRLCPGDTILGFIPESARFLAYYLHLTVERVPHEG